MEFLLQILILIELYIILTVSLNIISGYGGLISLAHASFYGLGAYVASLMAINFQTPYLVNFMGAVFLGFIIGCFVGLPSLRVRGDYLVIMTFAFQVIAVTIFNNWEGLTGGPRGLYGIPKPSFLGFKISSRFSFFVFFLFVDIVILGISYLITTSPYGRVLKAIREDEKFALSLGKNVANYKVFTFGITAAMAAAAGALYSSYIYYIHPFNFTLDSSILIIAMVIFGGAGNIWGSTLGAALLVALPEALRFLGVSTLMTSKIRAIIYGAVLVIFIMYKPSGLIGEFNFISDSDKDEK
jgi:branched-chain amino acid transport system permease protein